MTVVRYASGVALFGILAFLARDSSIRGSIAQVDLLRRTLIVNTTDGSPRNFRLPSDAVVRGIGTGNPALTDLKQLHPGMNVQVYYSPSLSGTQRDVGDEVDTIPAGCMDAGTDATSPCGQGHYP